MKFEVINETLKIAACGLADLTLDHVTLRIYLNG